MGQLAGDDVLAQAVARRPSPELLCALVIATTCTAAAGTVLVAPGTTAVPGFPATDLLDEDGPWQHALPAAADLGAPAALLGKGGWPALWRRAHR